MKWFGKSLRRLEVEHAVVERELDDLCMSLIGRGVSDEQLTERLMPLATKSAELQNAILRKTPRRKILTRRDELKRRLAGVTAKPTPDETVLQVELSVLQRHLDRPISPRDEPVTLKTILILSAVVLAMVYLPEMILDWLLP